MCTYTMSTTSYKYRLSKSKTLTFDVFAIIITCVIGGVDWIGL